MRNSEYFHFWVIMEFVWRFVLHSYAVVLYFSYELYEFIYESMVEMVPNANVSNQHLQNICPFK